MIAEGARVLERETNRTGTVAVLTSLDWPEVQWDDEPMKLALVHSSKLEPLAETKLTEAGRAYAERQPDSLMARVALSADAGSVEWPVQFREVAIRLCNEEGESE